MTGTTVIFSTPIKRVDNTMSQLCVEHASKKIKEYNFKTIDNSNIQYSDIGKNRLHLNKSSGGGKLAVNLF